MDKNLRSAAVVIVPFDKFGITYAESLINHNSKSTVFQHTAKVLVIVPKEVMIRDRFQGLKKLMTLGFLNVISVHETAAHDIRFETYLNLNLEPSQELNDFDTNLIIPDKLIQMTAVRYQIVVYHQIPRLVFINGLPKTPLMHFITAVLKIQNAAVDYIILKDYKLIYDYWKERKMDLTLNTVIKTNSPLPKLLTYEVNHYCALVPLPPKISVVQLIFIDPFDGLTWMFFVLTLACSVAVWLIFRGHGAVDSPWLLGYGMFVMFIGQGVDFSHKNRLVLTILLQLIIVMVWILSNAYEGVITSFMIKPIHENRLETFDDLFASDFEIITDQVFGRAIKTSMAYSMLKHRLNLSGNQIRNELNDELQRQHYAFIMNCDLTDILINVVFGTGKRVSDSYYLLPQKFFMHYEQLEASYLNPFIERLQYYMDLSFQAGLMHIWRIFTPETRVFEGTHPSTQKLIYLKLKDLAIVFYILIVGCVISTVLFFIEIFFHDILVEIKLGYIARNLKSRVHHMAYKKTKQQKHPKYQKGALYYIIHRRKRVKRLKLKKLKIRRIYVQPRFPMD
ncbi:unnamed protein product [Chironomus riparius]|uniref:Ionotropic receptor n=1 Tax=Chironomus riparius TaxID=315576 RepID=A0A9N9WQN6_9DIPT|nr:unnamed protein product [Chironomus riparius]